MPEWISFLISIGVPSVIFSFVLWRIERGIIKREAERDKARENEEKERMEREFAREKNESYIIKTVGATMALAEATARAVQRIPDAHCNGDMHTALDYATRIKHEQKDFLNEQALKNMY